MCLACKLTIGFENGHILAKVASPFHHCTTITWIYIGFRHVSLAVRSDLRENLLKASSLKILWKQTAKRAFHELFSSCYSSLMEQCSGNNPPVLSDTRSENGHSVIRDTEQHLLLSHEAWVFLNVLGSIE